MTKQIVDVLDVDFVRGEHVIRLSMLWFGLNLDLPCCYKDTITTRDKIKQNWVKYD